MRPGFRIAVLISVVVAADVVTAQPAAPPLREVLSIGGRTYVASRVQEDLAHSIGIGNRIAVGGDQCLTFWSNSDLDILAYPFDRWLAIAVPFNAGPVPAAQLTVQFRYLAPTLWMVYVDGFETRVRVVDSSGRTGFQDFVAINDVMLDGHADIDVGTDFLVVALTGGTQTVDYAVFGRCLALDGAPLGPTWNVAEYGSAYLAGLAATPGGASIAYVYFTTDVNAHSAVRYSPDGATLAPPPAASAFTLTFILRGLTDDSILLASRDSRPTAPQNYRLARATPAGAILGSPVDIGTVSQIRATSDGRIATSTTRNSRIELELFDAQWQPVGGAFPLTNAPVRAIQELRGMGYTDDGTIWISWLARDGFGGDYYLTAITPVTPGDLNGDGALNNCDIDPFVVALVDPAAYQATYNLPADAIGDFDGDGQLTNFDIDPFVDALLSLPP